MDFSPESFLYLWQNLIWPLIRLLLFISIGLIAANLIESLNWSKRVAAIARPLVRLGHFSDQVGTAFSMAIVSGVAANTMLSEAFQKGEINKKELVLANLLNSLPTYFLHLPTVIVITAPLIKGAALIYVAITFGAAFLRTMIIVLIGRLLLPRPAEKVLLEAVDQEKLSWQELRDKTWRRFKKRMRKIVSFTVPIYVAIFIMNRLEFFSVLEDFLAGYLAFIPWLSPQAMGIIALHLAAELTAGLAAAGALLQDGVLGYHEIVMALLVGNIMSSPLRAIRHQFPYYAGIFSPKLGVELIVYNQLFRILSLIIAMVLFFNLSPF
jgi:hypothetical protein